MGVMKRAAAAAAPMAPYALPVVNKATVHELWYRAVDGVGPLRPARDLAEDLAGRHVGGRELAVRSVIKAHVSYAGVQGFVTNLGGITTVATIPANIAGLVLVQSRMVAAIAHLRGHDVDDPRVRNAALVTLLTEDGVANLLKHRKLPATPMTIATAPVHDPTLDGIIAAEVTAEMLRRIAGKRVVTTVARRVPGVGGVVGATSDSMTTWQVGRYASREFLARGEPEAGLLQRLRRRR